MMDSHSPPTRRLDPGARIAQSKTYDPRRLASAERAELARSLLELYRDVFDGDLDLRHIEATVVETTSDESRILLHTDEDGRPLGFGAMHFFECRLHGKPVVVVRGQAAMRRSVRGQQFNVIWAVRTMMELRLRRPTIPFFGLVSLMHPASYLQIDRYLPGAWPRRGAVIPPDILRFMTDLADEFRMQIVDPARPLVREIGFRTRETEAERRYWKRCEKPAARFFLGLNPSYHAGHGLLTLVPFTPTVFSRLGARLVRDRAASGGERALDRLKRWPVTSRFLLARSIRAQLAASAVFSGLDDESVETLVAGATEVSFSAASDLLLQGAKGEAVYVVSRGIVSISIDCAEGEPMVEQLGRGSVFGEVALLSDGRRSESIRTITRSTLIQISSNAIRTVMDRNERARKALWTAFALRLPEHDMKL